MIFDNHTQSKHHARQEAGPPGATNTRRPLTTATETTVAVANPHFTFHHNRPVPSAERSCGWRIRKNSIYRSIFMSREPEPSAKFSRWRA